ncbi:MAG: mandelate racemase/muconate lactonizing enzyme family protein [Hyphomicrobiales bacterium]|nr:mandelate racemase/muconate lactonizing enzyme family protein [Hyphomicrobiales bacterium]
MKIADAKAIVVANPPPHFGGPYFIFVKLVTDGGVVGWGEVYAATFGPHVMARMVEDVCARHVIGADPFRIEKLWHAVYGAGYTLRPDLSVMGVLSAIETACWDIVGKECGRPVYDLLGGRVHDRLRTYTYLYPRTGDVYPDADDPGNVYVNPDLAAEYAADCVAEGFTAVKFDPAGPYTVYDGHQPSLDDIARSVAFVKKIRAAVGTRADLLFGTHGQFTAAGAIRLARQLEPYDPLWFEEPTPPENPAEMARVARQTTIPIATGERLTTKHEFARVLECQAAAILQPALGRCGGILEGKKIAAMAEAHYAQLAPHLYCGPIEAAANIQLATCSPNFLILESIQKMDGFHAQLLKTPLVWEDGYIIPPTAPGIGVELDEAVAEAHPWTGAGLHLSMVEDPVR